MSYNRIHATFDEPTLAQIDLEANKKGISRGKWLTEAVGSYLSLLGLTKGSDPTQVTLEGAQLRLTNQRLEEETQRLKIYEESTRSEAAQTKEELAQFKLTNSSLQETVQQLKTSEESLREELTHTTEKLAQIANELTQSKLTVESNLKESQKLKKAEESARTEAAQLKLKVGSLEAQLAAATPELERIRIELSLSQAHQAHFQDTIKIKDQEIGFLQAHIAQLTQTIGQIALKPGEEEAKNKGWWQFWRKA